MARDPDTRSPLLRLTPFRISAIYVLIGCGWILISDMAPMRLGLSLEAERMVQTLKGWGFVLFMGVLLFVLMRKLERTTRTSEMRLRSLIDNLPALVSYVGTDGRLKLLNRRFNDWFGERAEMFVGVHAAEALGLHADDTVKSRIHAALSGERVSFEHELNTVEGIRPVNVVFTPYIDDRGVMLGLYMLVTDLTGQREVEVALRHSEQRYRRLVEGAPVGILINQGGQFVYANQAAAEILGASSGASSPDELIGRPALDHVAPEFRPIVQERIAAVLDRGETVPRLEERFLRLDGSSVEVEVGASACVYEGAPAIQVVIRDISERVKAEQERRKSEERYRRIVETTHEGVWLVDADRRTVFVNRRMTEMLGCEPEELLGRDAYELVAPDQRAEWRELSARREQGVAEEVDIRLVKRSGEELWVHMIASPLLDEDGAFQGALSMVSDITDRVRQSQENQRLLTELRERVKEMQALNSVLKLLQDPAIALDRALADVARALCEGVQWTERSAARVVFDGAEHRTEGFAESDCSLSVDFNTAHGEAGLIEIVYPHGPGPEANNTVFLPEERDLLNAVASVLRSFLERQRASVALERSESLYRHVVEAQTDLICRWKPDTTLTFVNPAYEQMFGGGEGESLVGRKWIEFVPELHLESRKKTIADIAAANPAPGSAGGAGGYGRVVTYENSAVDGAGRRRWMQWRDQLMFDETGKLVEVQSSGRDITARVEAEQALRLSEERFQVVANATTDVIWDWDLVANELWWSEGLETQFGYTTGEETKKLDWWANLVHPDDRKRVTESLERTIRTPDPTSSATGWSEEYRFRRADGSYSFVRDHGQLLRDGAGRPLRMVGGITDITEHKVAERRQKLMMQELDHRVKNNLATVLSIADSTFRASSTLSEFAESFTGRIRALARVHSLLAYGRWEGVSMRHLVERTLEAYTLKKDAEVVIEGEEFALSPAAAPVLCMAIHELATNAAKYGSLSASGGRVEVRWSIAGETQNSPQATPSPDGNEQRDDASTPTLTFEWKESGGPAVTPPTRRGFGCELIEGAVTYELKGKVEMHFQSSGLTCTIQAPVNQLLPRHEVEQRITSHS